VKAFPQTLCRVRGLPAAPAVPDLNGDGWRVRCYFETVIGLLGGSVPVAFERPDGDQRRGRAFIASITRDGDPGGTGFPCQVYLIPVTPFF
jgi:hypothetical protein